MFGLHNYRGSCWVNACLQILFRIPDLQNRYDAKEFDETNLIDKYLYTIWSSKGEDGLKELFEVIRTHTMPAGNGIGDSHELFTYLCDKLPFLDELCRFKIADSIECKTCKHKEVKEDSINEFSISCMEKGVPLTQCIANTVTPYTIDDWKCEKCSGMGCVKQQLIGTFPKVMIFHKIDKEGSFEYSSILGLNKNNYALTGVCCYGNFHWWAHGRNMPPGSSWFTLNDKQVREHGPKQFPISPHMKLLIYYRLEN